MFKRCLLISSFCVALDSASAQNLGEEKLDDVVVVATKVSKYRNYSNNVATMVDVESEKLPIIVDIMTEDYIRDRGVSDIFDLVRMQPGVNSEGKTTVARTSGTYTIRGFSGNEVLMNGLVLSGARGIWLDPSMMESVQIIKGPAGAIYGSAGSTLGAYGATGTIIVKPKHASVERGNFNDLELKLVGGNERNQRLSLDSNLLLNSEKNLALRLPMALSHGKPFYDVGGEGDKNINLAPSLIWQANSDLSLGLAVNYQSLDYQSYQGIYTFKGEPSDGLDWDSNPCDEDMRTKLDAFFINGFADWQMNNVWRFKSSFAYSYSDTNRIAASLKKKNGNISKTYCVTDEIEHAVNLAQYATAEFETGEVSHALTIGATYSYTQREKRNSFNLASLDNLNLAKNVSRIHKAGIILEDAVRWNDWFLLVGGSGYLYRSAEGDDAFSWSPRVGLSYQVNDDLVLFGNVSTTSAPNFGFRGKNYDYLTNSWRSWQSEAGIRYKVGDDFWATLAAFYVTQKNKAEEITDETFYDPDGNEFSAYEAEGQSNTRGIEFTAVGNINKNWSMNFAYAYTQYMGEQGKFDRYAPHAASIFTTYKVDELFNGTVFGFGLRWRQKSYLTMRGKYISENDYLSESVSVDASVEVPINLSCFEKSSLHFGIKNIFDERFVESARNNECFINPGRTFELSFRASF